MANSVFGARIDLKVNKSNTAAFREEIQAYVDSATSKTPIRLKNFKFDMEHGQRTTLAKQLQDDLKGANFDINLNHINADGAIKNLKNQIKTMMKGLTIDGVQAFVGDIEAGGSSKKGSGGSKGGAKQLSADAKAAKAELSSLGSQLNSLQKKINKLGTGNERFNELIGTCRDLRKEVEDTKESVKRGDADAVSTVANLNTKVVTLAQSWEDANRAAKAAADGGTSAAKQQLSQQQQAANLLQQTQKYIDGNQRAYAAYGAQFDNIVKVLGEVASAGEATEENAAKIARARLELTQLKTAADAAGISGLTFGERFKKGLEKFGGWAAVTATIQKTIAMVKKMAVAVKEVDDAMTELKKVTDLTSGAYDAIYLKSVKTAKAVGASIADTLSSTAEFARLGFSADDATELAKAALIYKNVGDGVADISAASESLISTMKGFGIEAENAMHIVDAFNEVGRLCPAA